jgi:superfamily II DNA or RNA helicase
MEKEDLLKLVSSKFEDLEDIFFHTNKDDRDEYQQALYEAYFNIKPVNIDNIKNLIDEKINKSDNFKFNKESYDNMIKDEDHEIILDFIWEIGNDEPKIDNQKILLNQEKYREKLKNGLKDIQTASIKNVVESNFDNGIVCIATGGGKSLIILKLINIFNNLLNPNKRSILIFTERKNILLDLFYILEKDAKKDKYLYVPNKAYWNVWKELDIINMDNFELINMVSNKDKFSGLDFESGKKKNLIIINRSFLTLNNQYSRIPLDLAPELVIYDECQGITARSSYGFLDFAKNTWKSKIIGFSATPIRRSKTNQIQKETNLNKIFNISGSNKLKIYQNYNILNAINDGICSKLNFVWYKLKKQEGNKSKNRFNDVLKDDVKNCMYILNDNFDKLYYKKIICWCSTIRNANLYKDYFKEIINEDNELDKLKNLSVYVDHSHNSEDYTLFYESPGNSILFCVGKHREGSDIKLLDCGMFLDKVEYRSDVVWLQSIGRIARLSENKPYGLIIDTYYERENENEHEVIIEKLIGYYVLLDSLTVNDGINKKEMYDRAKKDIQLDKKEEKLIHLSNFDIVCEGINWESFSKNFNHIFDNKLQKEIRMNSRDRLGIICETLKTDYGWNENTDFWTEYRLIDKTINKFPDDIYKEFETEFSKKTWYELLGFYDIYFKNIKDIQKYFKKNKIYNINHQIYNELCMKELKLPKYPDEFFRLNKNYTDISCFINNDIENIM